jgi:hypothetical protein
VQHDRPVGLRAVRDRRFLVEALHQLAHPIDHASTIVFTKSSKGHSGRTSSSCVKALVF